MSALLALMLASFRTEAMHRLQTFVMILGGLVEVFARISIWKAVYGGRADVDGVSLDQMIAYALIGGTLLSSWDSTAVVRDVGATIRTGAIASTLLRPASYPLMLLAQQLGARLFSMMAVSLPVILVMGLLYGLEAPASVPHGVLFIFYLALSTLILMLTGIIVGLLAFWVLDAHALEWLLRGLLAVLSGGLVPLWFFPAGLAGIAHALPFSWITYQPMAVYLGRLDFGASLAQLLIGVVWLCILGGIATLLWSRACRLVVVQGG
ncbi:ABC transporter permease [Rhizobium puerariae]|uniref:ABC transporter permease n=1 Tax=Rhizobium puerariae TaxID=1585791 RepID=A0ABV6ASV8_9HYPH